MIILSILAAICSVSFVKCSNEPCDRIDPALLLVSYDGFAPFFLDRGFTPFMNKFREEGVFASDVTPDFPTVTFTNHHTIVTGFHPETHGVIYNSLYDPEYGNLSYTSYELFHYNKKILPIYTLNEKAGRHSASIGWPGGEYEYDGVNLTYAWPFNASVSFQDRVDMAISCFTDGNKPANLVLLYFELPDAYAEAFGPDSTQVNQTLAEMDRITEYIQQQLIAHNLDKCVNVIHLSDHGMSSVSASNFIDMTQSIENGTYELYGYSPFIQVVPTDECKVNELYANLSTAARENGHFSVYLRKNLPNRWHIKHNRRVGPIVVVADIGYAFQDMATFWSFYFERLFGAPPLSSSTVYGIHGYDNREKSMHPLFMAKGPLFAKGKVLKPFHFVDLYNLFCAILGLEGGGNDGSERMKRWNNLFADRFTVKRGRNCCKRRTRKRYNRSSRARHFIRRRRAKNRSARKGTTKGVYCD